MAALYNEIDLKAAAWLRELIAQGHIAPGIVDERSIEDLDPEYLRQFTQVHFFAGIGVWSYALRRAGWPDDRPIWTGSCPCQPFSAAGKGGGFADERHLWPAFHWLIEQCRPPVVLGEQVASKDGLTWLDLVCSDLEGTGYAVGAADTCAAGFGAPHIRQRLYWCAVADAGLQRRKPCTGNRSLRRPDACSTTTAIKPSADRSQSGVADADGRHARAEGLQRSRQYGQQPEDGRARVGMGDADSVGEGSLGGLLGGPGAERTGDVRGRHLADAAVVGRKRGRTGEARLEPGEIERPERLCDVNRPGPTNGFWGDADWLGCRDGKWRPVEPGTFPLAHGASARVGRLRGYGNAIVGPQAQAFVEVVQEWLEVGDLC